MTIQDVWLIGLIGQYRAISARSKPAARKWAREAIAMVARYEAQPARAPKPKVRPNPAGLRVVQGGAVTAGQEER